MQYLGCQWMEHGLSFELNDVYDCCMSHHGDLGMPIIFKNYKGEFVDWDEVFEIKEKRIASQKKETIPECKGCIFLKEKPVENERYICDIAFQQIKLCNAKCVYCGDDFRNNPNYYDVYPIIKNLVDKGYFKPCGLVVFQGGEPTLMRDFDKLTELFTEQNSLVKVNTSAIKYSPAIYKGIKKGKVFVVVSIDSGTPEMYKKIKRVDAFDKVKKNISKYQNADKNNQFPSVVLKYIITPGYNDSVQDVDDWLNLVGELGIKSIAVDVENKYANLNNQSEVSPHVLYLVDYIFYCAEKLNIKVEQYCFAEYVSNVRKVPKCEKLLKNKPLFVKVVDNLRERNKSKNYTY